MLSVFLDSGCSDHLKLTAGKRRLEDIGGIKCSLCSSGTDNGMDLVYEEKDVACIHYFIHDLLDPLLKLTPVF